MVYQASSLSGYRKTILTTGSVSSSFFGYYKPWKAASAILSFFVVFALAVGEVKPFAGMILFLIGVGVAAAYYYLNKELLIGVSEINGDDYSLVIKRSVIEGQEIGEEQMKQITDIISRVIVLNRNRAAAPAAAAPAAAPARGA